MTDTGANGAALNKAPDSELELDYKILAAIIARAARRGLIVHDDLEEAIDIANRAHLKLGAVTTQRDAALARVAELTGQVAVLQHLINILRRAVGGGDEEA